MKYVKLYEEFTRGKKIIFVGDIMQHPDQLRFEQSRGFSYEGVFDDVKDILLSGDVVIGNLETTIDENLGEIKDRTGKFKVTPDFIRVLKSVGFTHLGVVNNHMYDYGKEGFEKTVNTIKEEGLVPLHGLYQDKTIDVITFTSHINGMGRLSIEEMKAKIIPSKTEKLGISFAHWGDQYNIKPTPEQKEIAGYLDSAGYKLVIGSGTHVYNDTVVEGDSVIAYSLGDFLSDHQQENTSNIGKILVIDTYDNNIKEIKEYTTETKSESGQSKISITGERVLL